MKLVPAPFMSLLLIALATLVLLLAVFLYFRQTHGSAADESDDASAVHSIGVPRTTEFPENICEEPAGAGLPQRSEDVDCEERKDYSSDVLKKVYERIEAYFSTAKPFLDCNLTINEVARSLYTNKAYVSRALNLYAGKNFCQYVNYYRVMYSMELFENNHGLKVNEMAQMSGFHSIASYNFSFRAIMNQSPGEWCRKKRMAQHFF